MDRLEAMTILLAAVDLGSLSAASRKLGIPLATVSRRVSELEEHLKIRLLLRGARKLTLTDAGRGYVASCRRIMEFVSDAERTASGEYSAPQGELSISVSPVFGRTHVLPVVLDFLDAYPDIRMRLKLTDRNVNLLEEHVDLAIRIGELPDSTLVATRIAMIRQVLCASPAYLKKRGVPKKPSDLSSHCCILYEDYTAGSSWPFRVEEIPEEVQLSSRLVVNSTEAALVAAVRGAGIARVLSYHADEFLKSKALVVLLEAHEPKPVPMNAIYPGQGPVPLKLRAFLDFSIPRLRAVLGYKGT